MFIVEIAGHLGRDPETRFTPNGQKVTSFTVAVNQRKGKEDVTMWVRITVWGDRFDKMISFLKKGSAVIVIGRMNIPTSYTDKEGRTQITLEVTAEMIEFSPFGKSDRQAEGQQGYSPAQQQTASNFSYGAPVSAPQHDSGQSHSGGNHYGNPQSNYQTQSGQGDSFDPMVDEDRLPF